MVNAFLSDKNGFYSNDGPPIVISQWDIFI